MKQSYALTDKNVTRDSQEPNIELPPEAILSIP